MKTIIHVGIVFVIALAVFLLVRKEGVIESEKVVTQKIEKEVKKEIPTIKPMHITSSVFKDGEHIPYQYTCDADNTNPPLSIGEVPENAKSLALIMDDPDAPRGEWVHWLIWNITPSTKEIAENSVPSGAVQGTTDFKKQGYGGPCPPDGQHRYFFKLYALDIILDLPTSSVKADLEKAMEGHIVSQTQLIGLYAKGY